MSQILSAIQRVIKPDLLQLASSTLNEDSLKVSLAISVMVPSILGSLLKNGNKPHIELILQSAARNTDVLSNLSVLFSDKIDTQTHNIGSNLVSALFGNKIGIFVSAVAQYSGVSISGVSRLLTMLASLTAGVLAVKLQAEGLNLAGVLGNLYSEKEGFTSLIPSDFSSLLSSSDNNGSVCVVLK